MPGAAVHGQPAGAARVRPRDHEPRNRRGDRVMAGNVLSTARRPRRGTTGRGSCDESAGMVGRGVDGDRRGCGNGAGRCVLAARGQLGRAAGPGDPLRAGARRAAAAERRRRGRRAPILVSRRGGLPRRRVPLPGLPLRRPRRDRAADDPNDPFNQVENMFSPKHGTLSYPTDTATFANNAADLVELRVKPLADATAFRVTLNTLKDADRTAFTIALGDSPVPLPWPHGAGVALAGAALPHRARRHRRAARRRDRRKPSHPRRRRRVDTGAPPDRRARPARRLGPGHARPCGWPPAWGCGTPAAGSYLAAGPGRDRDDARRRGGRRGAALFNMAFRTDEPVPHIYDPGIANTIVEGHVRRAGRTAPGGASAGRATCSPRATSARSAPRSTSPSSPRRRRRRLRRAEDRPHRPHLRQPLRLRPGRRLQRASASPTHVRARVHRPLRRPAPAVRALRAREAAADARASAS